MEDLRTQTGQLIESTFASTPYPGDDKVAAYARYGRSIADDLRGKHWSEVSLEVLRQHRWEIFLLTPVTFRYYAPVFMMAALFHHPELEAFADNLIFSLTPKREEHINNYFAGDYSDYFSRRVAAFSPEERATILSFLQTFSELYPNEHLLYDVDLVGTTIAFWRRA